MVPFAETKEQFGGYHVLECRDLDDALAMAERIPTLPHGGVVEVRAVEPTRLNEVIEAVYRDESRRVLATLIRLLGAAACSPR